MIDRDMYYLSSGPIGVMGIIYLIVFGIIGCGAGGFIYAGCDLVFADYLSQPRLNAGVRVLNRLARGGGM